jgi:hypothetical protein
MVAHAIGLFMRDFVPFFHFLNVVPLRVYALIDPVLAFMVILSLNSPGPGHYADSQRRSESSGGENSERNLGHDCILRGLGCDQP